MREVSYIRSDPRAPDQNCKAALLDFVFDVPYLLSRGVIPPLHVMNEVLKEGGGEAGMSPSTTWETFELSGDEYDELVFALQSANIESLQVSQKSRFIPDIIGTNYKLHRARNFNEWLGLVREDYEATK
jgi:hypothetical protein